MTAHEILKASSDLQIHFTEVYIFSKINLCIFKTFIIIKIETFDGTLPDDITSFLHLILHLFRSQTLFQSNILHK